MNSLQLNISSSTQKWMKNSTNHNVSATEIEHEGIKESDVHSFDDFY